MKSKNCLVVALDLTSMDETLLHYVSDFLEHYPQTIVKLVHVIPKLIFTDEIQSANRDITSPDYQMEDIILANLQSRINTYIPAFDTRQTEVIIKNGYPAEELASLAENAEATMLLVGNKKESDGSGIISRLVAGRVDCTVAFIPENWQKAPPEVLVSVDVNNDNTAAIEFGYELAKTAKGKFPVEVVYIMDLPPSSQFFSKTFDFSSEELASLLSDAFHKILSKTTLPKQAFSLTVIENEMFDIASHIQERAEQIKANTIVTNARTKQELTDFLIGTLSERLVERMKSTLIIIAR